MRTGNPLLEAFLRLRDDHSDPQARGRELEELVARVFRRAHFRVELDAGAARPRQTDLVATDADGATFLVETKWRRRPSEVGDVDALRSRLDRTPADVTGVLVSIGGFADTAVAAVEARRDRPVLLVEAAELEAVLGQEGGLRELLNHKQDALRLHGEVVLRSRVARPRRRRHSPPPDGSAYFVRPDGERLPWLSCAGGFGPFTFARTLTDPDWVPAPGAGVTVDLSLSLENEDDLVDALGELAELGWATGAAHWCIQQSTSNWHGIGAAGLTETLRRRQERYRGLDTVHHTEQLCYQDVCEDGFFTLTVDIAASGRHRVWHAELSLQLIGVPVDQAPIRELCRTLGIQHRVHFRPRTEQLLRRAALGRHVPAAFEPVAFVVEEQPDDPDDPLWVGGVVVRNPDFGGDRRGLDDDGDRRLPVELAGSELLVCDLGSWHQLGSPRSRYRLTRCESGWTSDAFVARVAVDWDDEPRGD